MKNLKLDIKGMSCTGCSARLEKTLSRTKGIDRARVNFTREEAEIEYDESRISVKEIKSVIKDAGFDSRGE